MREYAIGDDLAGFRTYYAATPRIDPKVVFQILDQIAMQIGKLLNHRYRIDRKLAPDRSEQTFIATDTHSPSQAQVVVKYVRLPTSHFMDEIEVQTAQRLFEEETRNLEQLTKRTDRIPALYASFQSAGALYSVREFITGTSLTEELQGNKLSVAATLRIVHEILTGLETIHSQKTFHGDLQPDNIIRRNSDGKLVLVNFGAVERVIDFGREVVASKCTSIPAPPGYSSGYSYWQSPSDKNIYAVGAIAIQCLTGSHPGDLYVYGEDYHARLEWQHLCPVDPAVAKVLNRMVETDDRSQRYTDATDALAAIESLIFQSEQVSASSTVHSNGKNRRNFLQWLGFGRGDRNLAS